MKYQLVQVLILMMFVLPVNADSHHPQEFLKGISGSKSEGEQIYQHFCANCHAQKPIISVGAPKIGDERDWGFRVQRGIEALLKHTDEGITAMPPRGGCFECTDEQLMLAIMFMLPEKEKKTLLNQLKDHKKGTK